MNQSINTDSKNSKEPQQKYRRKSKDFLQILSHYELVSEFNVGLKKLLNQGLSEPDFYGDLVYKLKKKKCFRSVQKNYRSLQRIGYNINIMQQSACLVFNPVTVNNFASLFNCTPVGRA